MTGYRLSPLGQDDLDGILATRRGIRQAETYPGPIHGAVETVAAKPTIGRSCEDARAGYRKYSAGSHRVFFLRNITASTWCASCIAGWILNGTFHLKHLKHLINAAARLSSGPADREHLVQERITRRSGLEEDRHSMVE